MTEIIMTVDALPSFLLKIYHVNMVRVKKVDNGISIEPAIVDNSQKKYRCPFLGTAKGGLLTVDKFIKMKHVEKKLEFANEKRLLS